MNINIVNSGSSGNCTIVSDVMGNQIMLDCGLKYEKIAPHIDFSKLTHCFTTHIHSDHTMAVTRLALSGIDVLGASDYIDGQQIDIPFWKIIPMKLRHNVPCFGFLVYSTIEHKKIAYITDTTYIPPIPRDLDCLMLECNYDEDILCQKLSDSESPNMGCRNHLSLQSVATHLETAQIQPKNLVLIHSSESTLLSIKVAINALSKYAEKTYLALKNFILEI